MKVKEHNNSSTDEVNKFNQLSQQWWDPTGPLKTLHQIQAVRLKFLREQINLFDKKILDVGCGGGLLTKSLAALSADVTGIDLAEDLLEVARKHSQGLQHPPTYLHQSAESYAEEHPETFDMIACLELIEHVPDPKSLLQALSHMLKNEGSLFISTINRNLKSYLMTIVGAEYLLQWLPKGTHQYDKFLKPSEIAKQARQYGLQVKSIRGIQYRPFQQDFVLSSDPSVNYIIHLVKD